MTDTHQSHDGCLSAGCTDTHQSHDGCLSAGCTDTHQSRSGCLSAGCTDTHQSLSGCLSAVCNVLPVAGCTGSVMSFEPPVTLSLRLSSSESSQPLQSVTMQSLHLCLLHRRFMYEKPALVTSQPLPYPMPFLHNPNQLCSYYWVRDTCVEKSCSSCVMPASAVLVCNAICMQSYE